MVEVSTYVFETSKFVQEDRQFIVINRRPVNVDVKQHNEVEQELYNIFKKYV